MNLQVDKKPKEFVVFRLIINFNKSLLKNIFGTFTTIFGLFTILNKRQLFFNA